MRYFFAILLVFVFFGPTIAQLDFDEHSETLPVFGLTLMPNNETFISLEADYDGMFIREREIVDYFEKINIQFSDDLTNWEYYDYWIANNRGGKTKVPDTKAMYNLVVDPSGTKLAIYLQANDEYNTEVRLYDLADQSQIAVFDLFEYDENVEHINIAKFDSNGENLILGTESHGTFVYNFNSGKVEKLDAPEGLQLLDLNYSDNSLVFAPISVDEYNTIKYGEGFRVLKDGNISEASEYEPSRDYTTMFSPTIMNKQFTDHYRQDFDTYVTMREDEYQLILYRNLVTYELISTEQKIDIKKN